jgi:DNA-binding IclR family transcriptional regulator
VELLRKAFAVAEGLGASEIPLTLGELTRRVGLPKPSVYRIVRSLVELGYAAQDPATSRYSLTGRLSALGRSGQALDLRRRALPIMERLHREFDETVNLAVLEGADVVYVHVLETTRPLRLMTSPDARDPFHTTSLGRAIVAWLPEAERAELLRRAEIRPRTAKSVRSRPELEGRLRKARRRGWAEDREENEPGVVCFGAPLLERGRPVAAVSVTLPLVRLTPAREREIVASLRRATRRSFDRPGRG